MKVYVVYIGDRDSGGQPVAAFSTREKAEKFMAAEGQKKVFPSDVIEIFEFDVDAT